MDVDASSLGTSNLAGFAPLVSSMIMVFLCSWVPGRAKQEMRVGKERLSLPTASVLVGDARAFLLGVIVSAPLVSSSS